MSHAVRRTRRPADAGSARGRCAPAAYWECHTRSSTGPVRQASAHLATGLSIFDACGPAAMSSEARFPVSLYGQQRPPVDEAETLLFPAVSPTPVRAEGPSPTDGRQPVRRRFRGLVAGGVAAAVLLALGATAAYAYAGDVPRGTTVLGIDLGGRSRAEATEALAAELARRPETFAAPVQVRVGEQLTQIVPAAVGLAIDVAATIEAAASHAPHPVGLLFGSRTVDPVVTVDADRLDAELRKTAGKAARSMTMPAIIFAGTTPRPVYPKPGKDLDAERSAQAVREGWLSGQPVTVPLADVHPATTPEEVDRIIAELATPAVANPVTVTTDRGDFSIPPAAIAKSLLLTADKTGKIQPRVDEKKLRGALKQQLARVEVKPKDATYFIEAGRPRPVPGAVGREVDTKALSGGLLAVLPEADGRTVKGVLKTIQPKTTTEGLARLGIKERVSTFTTNFTGGLSSPRSQNIVQIAKEVDGALVKPGQTFSLNGHTGERSYAQGYHDAPVILNGKLVPGVAGGTSQFTTTLFNATYYAGLEDVEHKPHSYWFSRYPPVIESTIFYPDLDFKFRNNTPYGVVIDTSYTSSSITVSIWSTKIYDSVTTQWSARRDITKPKLIYLKPGPTCIETNGIDGFTQDAWRIFRKGGKEIRREKFTWRYDAEPRYVCAEEPT
jgi:vancomycin resistance protein YoaR